MPLPTEEVANSLQEAVDKNIFVDISSGAEEKAGTSRERFMVAVSRLQEKGYVVHNLSLTQEGTEERVLVKVLCAPGITQREVYTNRDKIKDLYIL